MLTVRTLIKQRKERLENAEKRRRDNELLADINEITSELARCHRRYDLVTDGDLVDAVIYEELALRSRYAYLIKRAREEELMGRTVIK